MKRCAVINDLSGFGKCSLSAALPVLSAMGIEVHPLATAVLSNQTAYPSFRCVSLTEHMLSFIDEWKKLVNTFDGILTGFITDKKQLDIISHFIDDFAGDNSIVVADPVMADNGSLYDGYSSDMCDAVRDFCKKADVITPNTTELAVLADKKNISRLTSLCVDDYDFIVSNAEKLAENGNDKIVVTGCKNGENISNIVFENGSINVFSTPIIGGYFSGTGDIFSSVLTGALLRGKTLFEAVQIAGNFVSSAIKVTDKNSDPNSGVEFEKVLKELTLL